MSDSLIIFQDLEIKGKPEELTNLFAEISENLTKKGWSRDYEAEKKLENELYAINTNLQEEMLESTIFIGMSEGERKVTNILPLNKNSLTIEEYNKILNIFYDHFIEPLKSKYSNLIFDLTNESKTLEDYMFPESAKLLNMFFAGANKSTGSLHPMDRNRWYDFIISVATKNENFPDDILNRWLIEVEGYSENVASDLVSEFNFGVYLLRRFRKMS